jgi:DNA-binding protein H-NS
MPGRSPFLNFESKGPMPRTKSLQSLNAEIARLQHQAELLRAREKKPVLAAIAKAVHHYEITLQELREAVGAAFKAGRASLKKSAGARGPRAAVHPLTGRKVAAKYKHPKTGQTWSGRGSTPVWIREAETSGVKRETFVIKRRKG